MSEFSHDVSTITMPRDSADALRYTADRPMRIEAANNIRKSLDWFGYINHIEPIYTTRDSQRPFIKVFCIGASGVLRSEHSRSWKSRTIPSVIREVVTGNRFNFVGDDHSTVWPSLLQHGESDWQFISGLAKRIGYSLTSAGPNVFLKKRSTSLEKDASTIPVLSPLNGTLDVIRPSRGSGAPQGGELAPREAWAVDPRRVQTIYRKEQPASGDFGRSALSPIFNRITTDHAVGSLDEITARLGGESEANRMYIQATTSGAGDIRVRPGGLVFVRDVSASDWGYWFVHNVTHTITGSRHSMEMLLGRDAVGTANVLDPPLLSASNKITAKLLNGKWVA
jgi:hypothetical protein